MTNSPIPSHAELAAAALPRKPMSEQTTEDLACTNCADKHPLDVACSGAPPITDAEWSLIEDALNRDRVRRYYDRDGLLAEAIQQILDERSL